MQWTEQLVAGQLQQTQKIKKQTEENNAIADVNRTKAVLEVELQKQILQKEAEKNISLIQNEIFRIADGCSFLKGMKADYLFEQDLPF